MPDTNIGRDVIFVRQRYGAYITQTLRGKRASCTHGARAAAEALGRKLWAGRELLLEEVRQIDATQPSRGTTWLLTATEVAR